MVAKVKSEDMTGGVFALGNFDGVHRGHQYVLDKAVSRARELSVPACVLTFEPHPRAFFHPAQEPFRLTPFDVKDHLLRARGITNVVTMPFTQELANVSAQQFVENILIEKLSVRHIVAGQDFSFGHGREGDMPKLAAWLHPFDIEVTEIQQLNDREGQPFSSSFIRKLLKEGEVERAATLLGRSWAIEGIIQKGAQRGRTIGVPTANIPLGSYVRPRYGVYAIQATRQDPSKVYHGVANIGMRPTVGGRHENLEAHLFDFDEDIYGQSWSFSLEHFIRGERKFDGLDALKAQINDDIARARGMLT